MRSSGTFPGKVGIARMAEPLGERDPGPGGEVMDVLLTADDRERPPLPVLDPTVVADGILLTRRRSGSIVPTRA